MEYSDASMIKNAAYNDRREAGKITDTQRIDFIGSLEQGICQLSMPSEVVENNLILRDAIDECIKWDGMSKP